MLLEIKDLGIAYGKAEPVVRHVSFTLDQGEILAIVGESGSGKTTVIRAIQHVLPGGGHIAEGTMIFEGEDTQKQSAEKHRMLDGKDVSMIFQDSGAMMNPIRPIGVQFREYLALHGMTDEKEAHQRMVDMLSMVRLPDPEQILKSYTFELSGGMRQRVGIARAYCNEPKVLFLDEPFGHLDAQTRYLMQEEIMRIWDQEKRTVLFVTNNIEEAIYLADRIIVLSNCPTHIKAEYVIDLPRPRNLVDPEFLRLRSEITVLLDKNME